jgi:hypothetical protein
LVEAAESNRLACSLQLEIAPGRKIQIEIAIRNQFASESWLG